MNSQTRCTVQLASRWPKQAFAHTGCLNRSGQCCAFSMLVGLVVKWFSGLSFCGGRDPAGRCQKAACVAGAGDLRCASACAGSDCRRGVWGVGAVIPSACIASPLLTEVFSPYAASEISRRCSWPCSRPVAGTLVPAMFIRPPAGQLLGHGPPGRPLLAACQVGWPFAPPACEPVRWSGAHAGTYC